MGHPYIYRNEPPESVKDCRGKGVESLILLHNLSLFLNPWRNVKEEKEMNKIETMKRKEIIENLKYVEKIAIEVQAMALVGIEAPEHHLISMDELEGLRSGSEFVLQALYEVFPELMHDDTVLDLAGTGAYASFDAKAKKNDMKRRTGMLDEIFPEVK